MARKSNPSAADHDVLPLILEKLKTSCLGAVEATALMIGPADPDELAAQGFPRKKAFEIPYFTAAGLPSKFKRWRYLEDTREGFQLKTDTKPMRYVQAKNTLSEVYLPPLVNWEEILKDVTRDIIITEGELKAACATKYGFPCMGLGGVYSFKSNKKKLPLLPIFYNTEWAGRKVYVLYDSDAATNPMVVAARNELCKELLAMGATPYVAEIPPTEAGDKQGLDDMVLTDGPDALADVLAAAESFATSAALHELNEEVAYIRDPGMIVVLDSGLKMRPSDFSNHAYANWHYHETSIDAKGNPKSLKQKAAPKWLEWEYRLELARITYTPGQPQITDDAEFNTWKGWGCEPVKGDVTPWKKLLDFLFDGYPVERDWFERWCAYPIQHPGAKMYTSAVMWGIRTGTGKSIIGYTLGRIYGTNFAEITDRELQDSRNEWAQDKQFVMGDDVTGQDQRKYADRLKTMITQSFMRIDPKYVPSFTVPDRINYYFTSNHPDAFFLEDDDRRCFVHEVQQEPLPREFYKTYRDWMNGGGPSALFHHLRTLDLKGMEAEDRAPSTNAKKAMIDDGLSELGRWVRRLKDTPDRLLAVGDAKLPGDLWSANELITLYDPDRRSRVTSGGLGKEMKRAGLFQVYKGMPLKTVNGQQRLFAVRNIDRWAGSGVSSTEIIAHYDQTRGPVVKGKKY
jgi:hypothetical protein